MNDSAASITIIVISCLIAGFILLLALSGSCSMPSEDAEDLLERQGYTEIEMTGYAPLACGQGDVTSSGFRAKSPNGSKVKGTVCCGALKGCTIRFK